MSKENLINISVCGLSFENNDYINEQPNRENPDFGLKPEIWRKTMKKSENFDLKNIGKRMKLIRARLGMTQSGMANQIGISLSHYSKLEIGIGGMSRSLAFTICKIFDIDRDWFLEGKGVEPPNRMDIQQIKNTTVETVVEKHTLNIDDLEKIIDLVLSKRVNKLAKIVSKQTNIPVMRALAILIHEQLVHPTESLPGTVVSTEEEAKEQE